MLQTYQIWLDRWTPHTTSRWVFTVVMIVLFLLRIVIKQVKTPAFFIFSRSTKRPWTTQPDMLLLDGEPLSS